jgi:hypothetical protein
MWSFRDEGACERGEIHGTREPAEPGVLDPEPEPGIRTGDVID